MECPHCKQQFASSASVKCEKCGCVYQQQDLLDYEHLRYLIQWVDQHAVQIGSNVEALKADIGIEYEQVKQLLQFGPFPIVITPAPAAVAAAPVNPEPQIAAVPLLKPVLNLESAAAVIPVTKPLVPPSPPRPPIKWNRVWNNAVSFVVSGALLRALLYMGSFMIVVSAVVLVVNFWNIFPRILQSIFIFSLPSAFYGTGWMIRTRLKLSQAGMVITAIGAILLAIDFVAIYQFGKLGVEIALYWLFASLIITAIYFITAALLKKEFFDYLALLGGTNVLLALARVFHAQLEWIIAMIPLAGLVMIALAATAWRRSDHWLDMARAMRRLPQVFLPISLVSILFMVDSPSPTANMIAFLFSAVAYGLLTWKFPARRQLILALTSLVFSVKFGISIFDLAGKWQATAFAVLSAACIFAGGRFAGFGYPAAISAGYRRILNWGGYLLGLWVFFASLVMALFDQSELAAPAVPLTVLALSFCAWHRLLKKANLGIMGCTLLFFAVVVWFDAAPEGYSLLAYLLLILCVFLPCTLLYKRFDKKMAAPFEWSGWVVSGLVFIMSVNPDYLSQDWAKGTALILLAAYYIVNAWYLRNPVFIWAAAAAFPLGLMQYISSSYLPITANPFALIAAAFSYLVIERLLHRRKIRLAFRLPLMLGIFFMTFIGLLVSLDNYEKAFGPFRYIPLSLLAGGLVVLLVCIAARLYQNRWLLYIEPLLTTLLAVLFFNAYSGLFFRYGIERYQYALVFSGVGWINLLAAVGLDGRKTRYSQGLYLGGYGLTGISVLIGLFDLSTLLWVLGTFILAMSASSVLVHYNRQRTWLEFARRLSPPGTILNRLVSCAFQWAAAWLIPFWLTLLAANYQLAIVWTGAGLVLLAILFITAGLLLGRINKDYSQPWYSAGYTLTVIGALLALLLTLGGEPIAILILALVAAVYIASAVIFRKPFCLTIAACLIPITLLTALDHYSLFNSRWIAWLFTGLAFLYFGLAQVLNYRKLINPILARLTRPLYVPGYLLSGLALVIAYGNHPLTLGIYPAIMLLCALSAWRFNHVIFIYPAVWLSVVPFYDFFDQILALPIAWSHLAWLLLILVLIGLGRFIFHKRPLLVKTPQALKTLLSHPAVPFYALAYTLTLVMIFGNHLSTLSLAVTYAVVAVLYLASALLFRSPAWLYPMLITVHLTILTYFNIHPTNSPARLISLPFMALTWVEILVGYYLNHRSLLSETVNRSNEILNSSNKFLDFSALPSRRYISLPTWSQPILIFAVLDTLVWEGLALTGLNTGIWVSTSFFLLYALLAMLWQDQLLAYISLAMGTLALSYQVHVLGLTIVQTFACLSSFALALYLFSWIMKWLKNSFALWHRSLFYTSLALAIFSLITTLPAIFSDSTSTTFAIGFSGVLFLTMSLRQHKQLLGYLAMGMLIASWSLLLFVNEVGQSQFYAIPAGLYLAFIGYLERTRRPGLYALLIESLGLALLLVTSLIQSFNFENGFAYFLILLAEGLLVIWWGAARRLRVPFIIGLVASAGNVLAQIIVMINVYDINRWIIIFTAGLLLVGLGIFVERRRDILQTRAQGFREMLERWN